MTLIPSAMPRCTPTKPLLHPCPVCARYLQTEIDGNRWYPMMAHTPLHGRCPYYINYTDTNHEGATQ